MHDRLHMAHATQAWKTIRTHPLLWVIAPAAIWAGTGAFLDTIGFFLSLNPFARLAAPGGLVAPFFMGLAPLFLLGAWTQGTILHLAGSHARDHDTHIGHGITASVLALPKLVGIHIIGGSASLFAVILAWGMHHGTLLASLPLRMHRPLAALFLLLALFFILNWQWLALAYAAHAPKHVSFLTAARAAWFGITHNTFVLLEHNILLFLAALLCYGVTVGASLFLPVLFAAPAFLLATYTGIPIPIGSIVPILQATMTLISLAILTAWATSSWAHLAHRILGERVPSSFWRTLRLYSGRE